MSTGKSAIRPIAKTETKMTIEVTYILPVRVGDLRAIGGVNVGGILIEGLRLFDNGHILEPLMSGDGICACFVEGPVVDAIEITLAEAYQAAKAQQAPEVQVHITPAPAQACHIEPELVAHASVEYGEHKFQRTRIFHRRYSVTKEYFTEELDDVAGPGSGIGLQEAVVEAFHYSHSLTNETLH